MHTTAAKVSQREPQSCTAYRQTDRQTDRRTDDVMMPIADHTVYQYNRLKATETKTQLTVEGRDLTKNTVIIHYTSYNCAIDTIGKGPNKNTVIIHYTNYNCAIDTKLVKNSHQLYDIRLHFAGMGSSRTGLDLEDSSRTKFCGLGLGLGLEDPWPWPWPWPRQCTASVLRSVGKTLNL